MSLFSLEPVSTTCPYCRSSIELVVDASMAEQRYVDDCPACHRAMNVHAMMTADEIPSVEVFHLREA
ncbi:MAG: Cysteine-rich [Moraxellaceae bacterium]|nr:Cysteine-rich [Moraxellaceae bacterium]